MTDQTIPAEKIRALLDGEGSADGKIQAIRDLLPPVLPDPLFGAQATHSKYGEGIVVSHHPDGEGCVRFMFPDEAIGDGTSFQWVEAPELTFHTPDHPVFLETEEDYRNAPDGTIVAEDRKEPYVYLYHSWRGTGSGLRFALDVLAGTRRRVLRWGWEA